LFVLLRVSAPVLNSRRLFIYLPPRSHIMLWWQAEFGFFILRLLFFKKKQKNKNKNMLVPSQEYQKRIKSTTE